MRKNKYLRNLNQVPVELKVINVPMPNGILKDICICIGFPDRAATGTSCTASRELYIIIQKPLIYLKSCIRLKKIPTSFEIHPPYCSLDSLSS